VKRMVEQGDCIATLSEIRMTFEVLMNPIKPTVIKFIVIRKVCRLGQHVIFVSCWRAIAYYRYCGWQS
jgi:hypothetical protein